MGVNAAYAGIPPKKRARLARGLIAGVKAYDELIYAAIDSGIETHRMESISREISDQICLLGEEEMARERGLW